MNDTNSIKTTVTLPKWQVAELDRSVEAGVARSRSELIAIEVGVYTIMAPNLCNGADRQTKADRLCASVGRKPERFQ